MTGDEADLTVLICTRNRSEQLEQALVPLYRQSRSLPIVVVDQSDVLDQRLELRAASDLLLTVVRDEHRRGLSRARNLAWPRIHSEWVVLLDDDCLVERGWVEAIDRALRAHPEAEIVTGHLSGDHPPEGEYLSVTTHPVHEERIISGRWTKPWDIGFTASCAIRRSAIERLGGWDEHLGAGAPVFPAGEDMDFNYRFLKSGGVAFATPSVRINHHQWRSPAELGPHFGGYMKGWTGFAVKQLRSGDVLGGLWLWSIGLIDTTRMFASAIRRRSRLRLRVAGYKLAGLASGTVRGLVHRW